MARADLFGWQELKAAQDAVAQAHANRSEARRRARACPHGTKRDREEALKAATLTALRAELALASAQTEAGL